MSKRQPRGESFAQTVARMERRPVGGPDAEPGHWGQYWGDQDGRRYELVSDSLTPAAAQQLASHGAGVVDDACGCGGQECALDWLSADEIATVAASDAPVLHRRKDGRADLEHWRSKDGADLVVAAVDVSWGNRFG